MCKLIDVGYYGEYITDLSGKYIVRQICEVPASIAVAMVQAADSKIGYSWNSAKKMPFIDGKVERWQNKGFYIVSKDRDTLLAVYQHDGLFYLYKIIL